MRRWSLIASINRRINRIEPEIMLLFIQLLNNPYNLYSYTSTIEVLTRVLSVAAVKIVKDN